MTDLFLELKLDDTNIHKCIKHLILNVHLYFSTNKLLLERHQTRNPLSLIPRDFQDDRETQSSPHIVILLVFYKLFQSC